jgi:hypothetical protein
MDDFALPTDEQIAAMNEEFAAKLSKKQTSCQHLAELCEEQASLLMALVVKCSNKLLLENT